MASAQLTDEELFAELKRLGVSPGPVTENTRPVYLKRLKKLREEQQQQRSRGAKGRSGGSINNNNSGGNSDAAAAARARPTANDVTRLSASRSPAGRQVSGEKRPERTGKFVLGFSSDESDVEAPRKKGGPNHGASRRERSSGLLPPQSVRPPPETVAPRRSAGVGLSAGGGGGGGGGGSPLGLPEVRRGGLGSPWWAERVRASSGAVASAEDDEDYGEETERNGTLNGSRSKAAYGSDTSKFAGDYSDSEEEEDDDEEEEEEEERRRERRPLSRRSISKSSPPPYKSLRESAYCPEKAQKDTGIRDGEDDETDSFSSRLLKRTYPKASSFISGVMGENGAEAAAAAASTRADKNHVNVVDGDAPITGRFSVGLRHRFPPYSTLSSSYRPNHSNHTGPNHNYSPKRKHSVPEDELLQQFGREEASGTGSFSAHYLSMFLLTAACLFFVLLGLVYLRMRGSITPEVAVIKSHPFGADFDSAYNNTEKDLILGLLLHLHDHLADIAGDHDCKDLNDPLNRSVSFSEATKYLMLQNKDYGNWIQTSLEWVIRTREIVGIRLIAAEPAQPVEDVSEISRLESTHPRMSFSCRLRRAFFTVIYRLLLVLAGVGFVWGLLYYIKYRWRREEEETRQMYDMVERIIDVLRSHNEENKDLQPYLPIAHVRDSLIQPQDRKKMKRVWDRAETFLSANESRIRTETQRIRGADLLVWRWLQPSLSSDKMCNMPSKVWQGKAFPLDRRNSPPNSLTPCLKIRNMFDPIMEVGEDWHLTIHEAILEKCSDNDGIVHIAVDKNSREGCVYVKCLSAEHAGKAFKALHGSWFDGKLVTVKYLRLDRYHQRFPQALGCNTPLKASSSSLSTMSHLHHRRSSTSSFLGFS